MFLHLNPRYFIRTTRTINVNTRLSLIQTWGNITQLLTIDASIDLFRGSRINTCRSARTHAHTHTPSLKSGVSESDSPVALPTHVI